MIPDWIPSEAWAGFVEMRKRIKKPLTERAIRLAVSELEKLKEGGHDPEKVLDQSTFRNYQGLFPLKAENGKVVQLSELRESQGTSIDELKRMGAVQ